MTDVMTGRHPGELKASAIDVPEGQSPQRVYRCKVYLVAEDDGGLSVYAAALPGVASQGRTEAEALANVVEAFEGAIASYVAHDQDIPWLEAPREPEKNEMTRWVVVHG